jgi:AAA+ ATPase superfamily predicted ATPase
MRLIVRNIPATESQPEKSKKGLYQIDDHFLRFWFRYVHPNQTSLDLGLSEAILKQRVEPDLDHFAAAAFEEAARSFAAKLALNGMIPFLPERIGGWWDRETEMDVLAISLQEKAAFAAECKWSINPVGTNILSELQNKSKFLIERFNLRKVIYALFSRAGYTSDLVQMAKSQDVQLYCVDDLVKSD